MPPDADLPYAEVIGESVAHSKSPLIHRHWLRSLGVKGDYFATAVHPDELAAYLNGRRADLAWRGCNVTIPHKHAILRMLHKVDERAATIGAVNCVVPTAEGPLGYNTDVDGIAAALHDVDLSGRKVAIIGAGGAARAALAYLSARRPSEILVLARTRTKVTSLECLAPGKLRSGSIDEAHTLLDGTALVINASPLGMSGFPVMSEHLLRVIATLPDAALFDMVYAPLQTQFLQAGNGRTIDGLTMLIGQAARAFELFFGVRAPEPTSELRQMLVA